LLTIGEPTPPLRAAVESTLACLVAMQGRFDEARELSAEAAAIYDGLGLRLARAGLADVAALVEVLAGDVAAAERERLLAHEILDLRLPWVAAMNAAQLARFASEQGQDANAERWLGYAREHTNRSDRNGLAELALAEAELALAAGHPDEAERYVADVLAAVAGTESLFYEAQALAARAAIRGEEPTEALALYERKGNRAAAERLREVAGARLPR
jgi:hypothetical protein